MVPVSVVLCSLLVALGLACLPLSHLPDSIADMKFDFFGALSVIAGGLLAGAAIGAFDASFARLSPWLALCGILLLVLLGVSYSDYLRWQESSPASPRLDWICDPSRYLGYGYLSYALGMWLVSFRTARRARIASFAVE